MELLLLLVDLKLDIYIQKNDIKGERQCRQSNKFYKWAKQNLNSVKNLYFIIIFTTILVIIVPINTITEDKSLYFK